MLRRGTLFCFVLLGPEVRLVLFLRSRLVVAKPPSLCISEADHGFAHLYCSTLTHLLGKEEGRECRTTLDGRVPTTPGELLAGNSSGSSCSVR
jgi:hypothetical protein